MKRKNTNMSISTNNQLARKKGLTNRPKKMKPNSGSTKGAEVTITGIKQNRIKKVEQDHRNINGNKKRIDIRKHSTLDAKAETNQMNGRQDEKEKDHDVNHENDALVDHGPITLDDSGPVTLDPYSFEDSAVCQTALNQLRWTNKQRTLVLSSRGVTHRHRHLMEDIKRMLPHSKSESKWEKRGDLSDLNDACEMQS